MSKPQVIFLDAVGTLFGVRDSVGTIYSAIAQEFGVEIEPLVLDQAFYSSFQAVQTSLAFPDTPLIEIHELEYQWWQAIAHQTFETAGVLAQFTDFDEFFKRLYAYFALAEAWAIYPDIPPTLEKWRREGIEMGIISNFDTRLHGVLETLGLRKYFKTITLSSITGYAKPNPKIFASALRKHHCAPNKAWYVGDSIEHDYRGAKAAGLQAFLIKRPPEATEE